MSSKESKDVVVGSKSFKGLGLCDDLVMRCKDLGMTKPTPIQINCIPKILQGSDCIGCAKTGSGKTAAFVLPIINKLLSDPQGLIALILAPTRELAQQIAGHFGELGRKCRLKHCVIVGGEDFIEQAKMLASEPDVIIAAPGRLADHIDSGTELDLSSIKYLVLDEADKLLEEGFGEQLQKIFSILPAKRQTLLFSATLSDSLKQLVEISSSKPFIWVSKDAIATADGLSQKVVLVGKHVKEAYLVHILNDYREKCPTGSIMIFANTCKFCDILATILNHFQHKCVALHSAMTQQLRIAALNKFKSNQVKILVSTDLASRGLDIRTVDLVINHNVPTIAKSYIHRVGRTARAGKNGLAITLAEPFDEERVKHIESEIGTQLELYDVNEEEIAKILWKVLEARVKAKMDQETDFEEKKKVNKQKKDILNGRPIKKQRFN